MRMALLATPSLLVACVGVAVALIPGGVSALQPMISSLKAVVVGACGVVLLADIAWRPRDAGGRTHRLVRDAMLVALALSALLLWTHVGSAYQVERFHRWEFFHHFVGAKYFEELGYTRLYDCVAVADDLSDQAPPLADRPVRRLSSNRVEIGRDVLAASRDCPGLFTPERWLAFQQDVAFFRINTTPRQWTQMRTDHGMNASPAWLVAGSWLANRDRASPEGIRWLFWLDPLLLVAFFGSAVWGFGWRPVCIALVFFGTLAPADVSWTGRAFLRFDWLAATGIGLALLARGRHAAAGALLTLGALLRVVPAFLIASLLLTVAIGLWREKNLRIPMRWRRFALGAISMLALVLPLSSIATDGFGSWTAFVANSRLHLDSPILNAMGWPVVVGYEHETRLAVTRDHLKADPYVRWQESRREVLARRAPLRWLGATAFGLLLAWAAKRSPDWVMGVLGVGGMVMSASLGAYYYVLLSVYAFLWPRHPLIGVGLCALALASRGVGAAVHELDEIYTWTSLAAVLFVLGATTLVAWQSPETGSAEEGNPQEST